MKYNLKSLIGRVNEETRAALDAAVGHAASQHHVDVTSEHLLLAMIRQQSPLFESLGLQAGLVVSDLVDALTNALSQAEKGSAPTPVFTPELVQWLVNSWLLASTEWGTDRISLPALMACLLNNNELLSGTAVRQMLHCDLQQAQRLLQGYEMTSNSENPVSLTGSTLDKYTRNLSELARRGELDPVLGREAEIRQMVDILLRRRQNNPILTGEPGVGKTALAEGLALRIAAGTVPQKLKSMEILTLDLGLLQAGASVKGEFENRLQMLLKEVASAAKPIILFIDEAHSLVGAGGQAGQNDAANLLKPALARGEIRLIAATTWAEYKKYFEKDSALARRFQVVKVPEPDVENATIMLRAMAPAMSQHHGVPVLESAIHAAVELSNRYIAGRQLPDKSVSLLDTACARVAVSQTHESKEIEIIAVRLKANEAENEALEYEQSSPERRQKLLLQSSELKRNLHELQEEWQYQRDLVDKLQQTLDAEEIARYRAKLALRHQHHPMVFECVDATCVADVVSDWTGIPLGRMLEKEHNQLDALFKRLDGRIVGQQHALEQITQQIRINRAGMGDPQKPTGVYLLAGPSGIGKTETSLALADLLFGGEQSLVTINMSEYQEAHSVSGLKGSPPGYVGYGQGGVLTEAVRRNPYSLVLLDEVEKAHPDVMEIFYQIFDKGMIEDAEGQSINFRNTLIIMTSNLASTTLVDAVESGERNPVKISSLIRPEFDRVLTPALMGRITLIPYLPLEIESLQQIIKLKLQKLCHRYQHASKNQVLPVYSKRVVSWVAERCQVKKSGARDIDQVLNQHLLPLLTESLLHSEKTTALNIDARKNLLLIRK